MAKQFTLTLKLDSHPEFIKNRDGLIGACLQDMGGQLLSGQIDLDNPAGNSITRELKQPGKRSKEIEIGSFEIIET